MQAVLSRSIPNAVESGRHARNVDMRTLAAIVLGGGQGSRLYPLTVSRCKPAISFGGNFRLIDVALSNSIHSGCDQIYIITQFLSCSLHKHIFQTYQGHRAFSHGFIDLLPAEQKPSNNQWYQGTADAVRQNLYYISEAPVDYFLILSGDQLYHMNFREMYAFGQQTDADVVIAALPIDAEEAKRMGVMNIDEAARIVDFTEKPQSTELLDAFQLPERTRRLFGLEATDPRRYLCSMGIYLFKRDYMMELLKSDQREDFGKHLLPTAIKEGNVYAFLHKSYWEDIGTVKSFYEANMALTGPNPPFNCFDEQYPLIKSSNALPGTKVSKTKISNSIICEGSLIEAEEITNSIIGPRSIIKEGCSIHNSYLMGNDFYTPPLRTDHFPLTLKIEEGCFIKNAIIDKDVHIGRNVKLLNKQNLAYYDGDQVFIRDNIIVVARGATLADGFTL